MSSLRWLNSNKGKLALLTAVVAFNVIALFLGHYNLVVYELTVLVGIYVVTWAFFIALTIVTILHIEYFLYNPNRDERDSSWYWKFQPLFMLIENGECIIVERGSTLWRMILNTPERHINRGMYNLDGTHDVEDEKNPRPDEEKRKDPNRYWMVVEGGEEPNFLRLRLWNPFSVYVVLVHRFTEAFWIGLYGYQMPRDYPLPRLEQERIDGKPQLEESGLPKYVKVEDRSAKIIVYQQGWPVIVRDIRTRDGYAVEFRLVAYIEITGLYQAVYRVGDSWAVALDDALVARISEVVRSLPVTKVAFAAEDETARGELAELIGMIRDQVPGLRSGIGLWDAFGIQLNGVTVEAPRIIGMSEDERLALTAKYRGEQQKLYDLELYEGEATGEANVARSVAEAVKDLGAIGEVALRLQALQDAAESVPPGSIVNLSAGVGGGATDPAHSLDPLILDAIKRSQGEGSKTVREGHGRRRRNRKGGGGNTTPPPSTQNQP